jgi:hypothetical protein
MRNTKAGDDAPAFCQSLEPVPPRPQSWNLLLELVHVGEELGVVANLFEAADEQFHRFDG